MRRSSGPSVVLIAVHGQKSVFEVGRYANGCASQEPQNNLPAD
jgi:hypothetical protein